MVSAVVTIPAIPLWYAHLHKPFFTPPAWVFGPAWIVLYALMGLSLFFIIQIKKEKKKGVFATKIFFVQLLLNFLWSFLFFGMHSIVLGSVDIIFLLLAIMVTMKQFFPLSKVACILLVPYLLWVSFATVLNVSLLFLNR